MPTATRVRHARAKAPARPDLTIRRNMVGHGGSRAMRFTAAAVKPAQPVIDARHAQDHKWQCRDRAATTNANRPIARASGGSASQRPAQEKARNNPATVASAARAGQSRSHKMLPPRARQSPREQKSHRLRRSSSGSLRFVQKPLRRSGSGESHTVMLTCSGRPGHAPVICAQSQSGMRSSAINWSTSRRGRTSAHSGH